MKKPDKPAYKIRLRDLTPGGIKRYTRRCGVEKVVAKTLYGVDPDQYDIMAKSRGYLLGLCRGVLVSGGALGIWIGLERILR